MSGARWTGVAAAILVACTSSPTDCTEIGCYWGVNSAVLVVVPPSAVLDGAELTVCVEGDCDLALPLSDAQVESEGVPDGSFVFVVAGADGGDEVTVSLEQPAGELTGSATMESSRPNGPDCGPTCVYAEVSLVAG